MSYSGQDERRRRRGARPHDPAGTRPRGGSTRPRISPQVGSYHGPRGTSSRPASSRRSSGPGYPLRARNINFQSGRARRVTANRRLLILGALALVIVILLVVLISSCVRGCSSSQQTSETNPVDARVAAGVSEDLTNSFSAELNRNEKLAQIAAHANEYDQRLLELALTQPATIDFVAGYPSAEKVAQPYGDTVTQGTPPALFCWDTRWGAVDYADAPLALTGSGPTALSMAYMGLTGKTDRTPADLAQLVTDAGMTTDGSGMSGDFLTGSSVTDLGLTCSSYASNTDNLTQLLNSGTFIMIESNLGATDGSSHWILVTSRQEDGTVLVLDPTNPDNNTHPWAASTVASSGTTLYTLSLTDADTTTDEQ